MSSTRKQSEASTKGVKLPSNLQKIKSGYRFRKSIPADVRHIIKQTEFIRALGKDYRQAVLECAKLEAEVTQMIEAARKKQRVGSSSEQFLKNGKRTVLLGDSPNLSDHAAALFLSGLDADLNRRRSGELDESEFADLSQTFDTMLQKANFAIATGNVSAYPPVIYQLLYFQGYDVQATAEQWQTIAYDFVLAVKPGIEALVQRQAGNLLKLDISKFAEKDPGPVWLREVNTRVRPSATAEVTQPRLSSVTPHYAERLAHSVRKTQTTSLSWWRKLTEFCDDKLLADVTSKDIYDFFKSRLHAPEKPWSENYCNKVFREFKIIFSLATTQSLCIKNPAMEMLVMPPISADENARRRKTRFPYPIDKLNILYSSEWYNPDSKCFRRKMKWDLCARYWIPLICLYHGVRVTEASQILASDVISGDHPLLNIQIETEKKEENKKENSSKTGTAIPARRLKNQATKRTVPVHPVLLKLGFMTMVSEAKSRGTKSPCFPSALPDGDSEHPMWGRSFEESFLRYVRDKLAFGNGYGSHSFRHTLEDCLRNIQLVEVWPAGLGQLYSGRAAPSDKDKDYFRELGSEKYYGKGFDPSRIMRYVEMIQYEGLKLPKPYEEWLDGRPSVSEDLIKILDKDWGSEWR